jgi:ABC-type sugar transport system ATPase subunit
MSGALSGVVVLVERLGGTSHVHVEVGPHRLLALHSSDALPDVGANVAARVRNERVHVFDATGRALRP